MLRLLDDGRRISGVGHLLGEATVTQAARQTDQFEADYAPGSGSAGLVTPQDIACANPPDRLKLSCGKELGPITIRYETLGKLSAARAER